MTFQDILKIFEENDNFLILTHKSPDGDTLGSGFALCAFLRDMGKKANVVNSRTVWYSPVAITKSSGLSC